MDSKDFDLRSLALILLRTYKRNQKIWLSLNLTGVDVRDVGNIMQKPLSYQLLCLAHPISAHVELYVPPTIEKS